MTSYADTDIQVALADPAAAQPRLTEDDINRLAAIDEETHSEGHQYRQHVNIHD